MVQGAIRVPLLVTQTAAQASMPVDVRDYQCLTFYIQPTGTTSGGTMVIEEADYDPQGQVYSGTWSAIGATILASALGASTQTTIHLQAPTAWAFVRFRIATAITGGGNVSITLRAS